MLRAKRYATAFLCACLATTLTACAQREVVTKVETQTLTPPPALTEPVAQPELRGETIGAALETIPDLRGALEQCNGRLGDVRRWASDAATDAEN